MKKFIAVLAILSIILTLASCNKNDSDIKEIVLGDEVESVVLTTVEGENITCTAETGFYEIFENCGILRIVKLHNLCRSEQETSVISCYFSAF